jgi:hypothetical protein
MISAIAKRRLALRKADGSFITVKPGEFVSLPEEVQHDPMYAWAVRDGLLVVSQQVIKAVEADVKEVAQDEAPAVEAPPEPAKKKTTKKKAADK